MKLKQVIDLVDGIEPNAYDSDTKTAWLNELEGSVQTDILLLRVEDVVQYDYDADKDRELLARPPHDKIYRLYLQAMIQFANAEYDRYANTMQVYNAAWGEYARWMGRSIYPAGREACHHGWYLSAYQLARIGGYRGSLADYTRLLADFHRSIQGAVIYSGVQELTAEERQQARDNLGIRVSVSGSRLTISEV